MRLDGDEFTFLSSLLQHGSLLWMAPELLFGYAGRDPRPHTEEEFTTLPPNEMPILKASTASDIWSIAMTIVEALTGTVPYAEYHYIATAIVKLHDHILPSRPVIEEEGGKVAPSDELWSAILSCWAKNPDDRLGASELRQLLETESKKSSGDGRL